MRPARHVPSFVLCLLLIAALPGWITSAAAQQQEKRLALVVGNGAYTKGALATPANDAGLIAQTLQAAGFDVIGARDLNGDTLRKSLHDFMQKVQDAGRWGQLPAGSVVTKGAVLFPRLEERAEA